MSQTDTQVYRVWIKATTEAIWDAITKSEFTERFGYGGRVDYDLRPGGVFRAYGTEEMRAMGAPEVVVEGEVIEADPPRKLVQTWRMLFDPTMAAEPMTRLTYEIDPGDHGVTRLTLTHEVAGAPMHAAQVSGSIPEAGGGWSYVLSGLKTLLETGKPLES